MIERIKVPGVRGITDDMSESVIDTLVAQGKLPRDFDFRLLGVDSEHRKATARADVLAALGLGDGSGDSYLTDALPDCVFVPGPGPMRPILSQLDDDYHMRQDLTQVMLAEGVPRGESKKSWMLYTKYLNPPLAAQLMSIQETEERAESGNAKRYQYVRALSRVAIRDEALLRIYEEEPAIPGFGPVKRQMLRHLLLDNHPELTV